MYDNLTQTKVPFPPNYLFTPDNCFVDLLSLCQARIRTTSCFYLSYLSMCLLPLMYDNQTQTKVPFLPNYLFTPENCFVDVMSLCVARKRTTFASTFPANPCVYSHKCMTIWPRRKYPSHQITCLLLRTVLWTWCLCVRPGRELHLASRSWWAQYPANTRREFLKNRKREKCR